MINYNQRGNEESEGDHSESDSLSDSFIYPAVLRLSG